MSARIDVTINATPSSPPAGATETGRVIFVGITENGTTGTPVLCQGFADFTTTFGSRVTATAALYDAVKLFFDEGGAECYVVRAGGPSDTITDYAAALAPIPASLGASAIAWPGLPHATVGAALAAHAAATSRLALLSCAPATSAADAATQAATVAALTGASHAALVWPAVVRTDDVTVDAVAFTAACRSRAHAIAAGVPAWGARFGGSRTGLVADVAVTDTDFATLDTALVSVIHDVYALTTLDGFHVMAGIGGNANLDEASQRDALNAIAHAAQKITTQWTGSFSSRAALTAWAGALTGLLSTFATAGVLTPPDSTVVPEGVTADPGYVVDVGPNVNTASDLATGNVNALISVRLTGSLEFADITISASDAASATF